jgi:hypothetical protein
MQVPLLDLKGQYAPLRAEIEAAIRAVCDEHVSCSARALPSSKPKSRDTVQPSARSTG